MPSTLAINCLASNSTRPTAQTVSPKQENPKKFKGIDDTFESIVYRTWFDVPIHRHNNINIVQAVTFPIFREVSKKLRNNGKQLRKCIARYYKVRSTLAEILTSIAKQVAVVFGVPNDFWGEEVAAAVVVHETVDRAAFLE